MPATPASRNHHAKQRQPYPLPTDPSKHVDRRLTASIRTAASHLRLLFLSPVCDLHRLCPPPNAARPAGRGGAPARLRPAATTPRRSAPLPSRLRPPPAARRGTQGAAAPRCTNAAGARRGPATAPSRLRPSPSRRFGLAYSCSSDGRAHRPQAQGGTTRPPPSPREMRAAGRLSFLSLSLFISSIFPYDILICT